MKNFITVLIVAAILGASSLAAPVAAQEKPEMTPEQAAEMEAWQKVAVPNEHHQMLAEFAGSWNFSSRWWSAPGEKPLESTGSAEYEMVMGGRYLKETVKSEWLEEQFEGVGYSGYDNVKKAYVSVWFDNMSTGILSSDGTWNAENKTLTWKGEYLDALTGKPKTMRTVTKIISSDKHVDEFFDTQPDGKEYKSMEIVYTRK